MVITISRDLFQILPNLEKISLLCLHTKQTNALGTNKEYVLKLKSVLISNHQHYLLVCRSRACTVHPNFGWRRNGRHTADQKTFITIYVLFTDQHYRL